VPHQCDLLLPVRDNLPRRSAKRFVMTVPEFGRCHVDYALMVRGVANLFGGRRPLNASDVIVTDVVAATDIMRLRTKARDNKFILPPNHSRGLPSPGAVRFLRAS
jgi:hypothetical protein